VAAGRGRAGNDLAGTGDDAVGVGGVDTVGVDEAVEVGGNDSAGGIRIDTAAGR
jgi:hypothetical protein